MHVPKLVLKYFEKRARKGAVVDSIEKSELVFQW